MTIHRRAVHKEQKEERRQVILEAARQRFGQVPYEAISMSQVAEMAGLAKGTLYLYFKTKEELFLALLEQEFAAWFDEIDALLQGWQADGHVCSVEEFVDQLGQLLARYPTAVRLIVISQAILEHNIDFPVALAFKQVLHARMAQTGALLEACLPFVARGEGIRLVLWIYLLIVGVQNAAEPAPVVRQILDSPGMEAYRVDFLPEITQILTVLLKGLAGQDRRQP